MNSNRWAPIAAAAAVLAVVAGYSLMSRDGGNGNPPMLRLAAAQGSNLAAADSARGSYRLIGTLPDGPSEARVRDLPATAVPVARVRAMAIALGETATPVRIDGAWKAGDLVVSDQPGNPWTWGTQCGPDTPVSSDGGVASDLPLSICAGGTVSSGSSGSGSSGSRTSEPSGSGTSEPSGSGTSEPKGSGTSEPSDSGTCTTTGNTDCSVPGAPPVAHPTPGVSCLRDASCSKPTIRRACPSTLSGAWPACDDPGIPLPAPLPPEKVVVTKSRALAATATIRQALGLSDDPTRVEELSVVVEPLAGDLPTNGMATLLHLSSKAKLVSASGSLSTGNEGNLYPLRSARKAFDGMPIFAIGAPCDAAGCPEGPGITGARLGLSLVALDKGAAALVPAWLFTVKDSPVPLVALAVADKFLGGPEPTRTNPGTEPGVIEPGTPEPGITGPGSKPTIEPGPDGSVPPPPPSSVKPSVPSSREAFGFDGAYADADPKVLVVRYGDSGSCPSLAVKHEVVESPNRVMVTFTRTPMPTDRACTMDYRAQLVRVALKAPLGSRVVVDGSRQEPVPMSTGTPPLG